MTNLFEKAFDEASKLPEIDQNALAKWVLNELQSEKFGKSPLLKQMMFWKSSLMRLLTGNDK